MAVTVVVFDVGETLVDEATTYERWRAERAPERVFGERDLHADAQPCLAALRALGLRLGAAGNMHAVHEDFLRPHFDFVGSSERWGVQKPDSGFFSRVVDEARAPAQEIVYVGDRVDNDVLPALAAGLHAVRIRRGAHADVESPAGTETIGSLAELPKVLERV
ncbi:MAG TPA: HAD family hydrolase [Gaiellaceae bacterium]|jgi:HAD superfamily hydrolase (TIGR01549 family)|nr:HAD family hydrolase [Gaiellaceae bacterium]